VWLWEAVSLLAKRGRRGEERRGEERRGEAAREEARREEARREEARREAARGGEEREEAASRTLRGTHCARSTNIRRTLCPVFADVSK